MSRKKVVLTVTIIVVTIVVAIVAIFFFHKDKKKQKLMDTFSNIQGLEFEETTNEMVIGFRDKIYYQILDIEWNGGTGIAQVKVLTPDLGKVIEQAIQEVIENGATDDYEVMLSNCKEIIVSVIQSDECPILERTIEMAIEKTNEGDQLVSNDEFERLISGNIGEIFLNAVTGGMENEEK